MTNNLIAQLDATIATLQEKRKAIDALLERATAFRASLLSPSALSLLEEPHRLIEATESIRAAVTVTGDGESKVVDPQKTILLPRDPNKVLARDLAGKTILECARAILGDWDTTLHYSEIAKEAIQRGYESARGHDSEAVVRSFWATLNRAPETFEPKGKGFYCLRRQSATSGIFDS